jgi:hypothetical protein
MTDLTPNDLSHLSDEEFNALCPQGHHATGPAMTLSPTAQAVLDAAHNRWLDVDDDIPAQVAAAALRAAADQVVPADVDYFKSLNVRRNLLAIAAELEGNGQ